MSGVSRAGSHAGPTVTAGFAVAGLSDFDDNGSPDYVLYNSSTRRTAIWYLNNYHSLVTPPVQLSWWLEHRRALIRNSPRVRIRLLLDRELFCFDLCHTHGRNAFR